MNVVNRLIAALLFLSAAVFSAIFFLCLFGVIQPHDLQLSRSLEGGLRDLLRYAESHQQTGWILPVGLVSAFALSVILFVLEIQTARRPAHLKLSHDHAGTTVLDLSAVEDLARWIASDTEGVETMPVTMAHRKHNSLLIAGMAILSPSRSAQEVMPLLQQNLCLGIQKATGLNVVVRLRSRFQDPRDHRRVR